MLYDSKKHLRFLHNWFVTICTNGLRKTTETGHIWVNGKLANCYNNNDKVILHCSLLIKMQDIIFQKLDQNPNIFSFHSQYVIKETVLSQCVTYTVCAQFFAHTNSHDCILPITLCLNEQFCQLQNYKPSHS